MIGHVSTLCLFAAAATFAGLWRRSRKKLHAFLVERAAIECDRADLVALLDTVPIAAFRFAGDAITDRYANFLAGLAAGDAARLEAARFALSRTGAGFSASATSSEGGALTIEGRHAASGENVLWVLDDAAATARQERDSLAETAAGLREMIDAIPMPVWRRDAGGTIVECNRACASAAGLPPDFLALMSRHCDPGAYEPASRRRCPRA